MKNTSGAIYQSPILKYHPGQSQSRYLWKTCLAHESALKNSCIYLTVFSTEILLLRLLYYLRSLYIVTQISIFMPELLCSSLTFFIWESS